MCKLDKTESILWPSLRESMAALQAAVSAYDQADSDYVSSATKTNTTVTDAVSNTYDAAGWATQEAAALALETAGRMVEEACDRYASSIQWLFDDCYSQLIARSNSGSPDIVDTDIESLLDEQRRIVFLDVEEHFESALASHKLRWDRSRRAATLATPSVAAVMKNALDSSERVVDAIESAKMNISVDWWTFRDAVSHWIQASGDENGNGSEQDRVRTRLFEKQNGKRNDSDGFHRQGSGEFELEGFCFPPIDSISLH
mmetsp:Transcript_12683/g.29675  ORF Transcript_12683/g.29675 Transcript_12683/m.29675 type:complete len:258 (+) Transcript_12683:416-1189(+)